MNPEIERINILLHIDFNRDEISETTWYSTKPRC